MKRSTINAAIALLLLVALLSATCLLTYANRRSDEKNKLESLKLQVFEEQRAVPNQIRPQKAARHSDVVAGNLKALQGQNEDLAAWLHIPGTQIDYPVMHTPELPEYYLRKDFEKKYSLSGLPFMQADCSLSPQSDHVILYGHNMKDGTMFSDLRLYSDKIFWNKHRTIFLYTPSEQQAYEIFAVIETTVNTKNAFEYDSFVDAGDEAAFNRFVSEAKRRSCYDTGIKPLYGDSLLTLSTCSNKGPDSRFVVVARKPAQTD